jgi:hypothetical protein
MRANGEGFPVRLVWMDEDGKTHKEEMVITHLPARGDEVILHERWFIVARMRFFISKDCEAWEIILDDHPEMHKRRLYCDDV